MLLFPFFLSVTLSLLVAIIFMTRRSRDVVNRWLSAIIILTVVFQSIIFFIMSTGRLTDFWYLFRMGCPFYYLTPPLIYLYISFILKKERKAFSHYIIHFIPFAISIVDIGWYYASTTAAFRINEISTIRELPSAELYLGAGFLPSIIHYYSRFIQRVYYVALQWVFLIKENTISKTSRAEHKWALLLTSAQTIIVIGYGYFTAQIFLLVQFDSGNIFDTSKQISVSIMLLGIIGICLYLFINPEILYGTLLSRSKSSSKTKIKSSETGHYDWLPTGANIEDYCGHLENFMQVKKPFLMKRTSIAFIANETDIPSHLLSALLNKHYGKSFSDFINEYRISYILNNIKENPNWDQFTIEGIALEAGFSSRTGFYTAFKKLTGKSPKIYLSEMAESVPPPEKNEGEIKLSEA